ncbi:nicotinate-nucleotide adenylyltransferase [Bacillus sp. OxB-1]|uniref:nicotinate-nucleotide adenylyltransferase n=1 Tax=Bacillus sp. (strain OxB-1) TaxID=98228 RepID=UPI000581CA29|nr:nicotinate-nucleotide adenylyltransferase [Bacillus sp. OxB-1]BAQ11513.1 nicotinate-nucleotide adenylyltransferase [Bacillus sp. OxB-1]
MKKVGILGGTFNPPHIGHLIVANEVRIALGLAEVRLMPAAVPPHKMVPHDATVLQRLHMVELAVAGLEGLAVSDFEVERGGISYTYDTMSEMTAREPDVDFHFIIGGDMIDMLPQWYKIDELSRLVKLVGVHRPGTIGETEYPIIYVDIPQIDLSSTMIRNRYSDRGTAQLLVLPAVEEYIHKENLYGS